jgi:eukaryotic-like serine/threonine-protein kinase
VSNLEYVRKLGTGSFSSVWLARDLGTGAMRAVKLVAPSAIPNLQAFNEEARVLHELRHPNIVSVYGTETGPSVGASPDVGMYAIVMEYMKDGSLEDALLRNAPLLNEGVRRFTEACRGAERVHASGYVHRDIKPANILLDGPLTKLSDFGLVQPLRHDLGSAAGTPYYAAPEVIETRATSRSSDLYSLGVTLYEVVNGSESLKWNGTVAHFTRAVLRGEFPGRADYAPFVPKPLRRIINRALHINAAKRFASVANFRHALGKVPIKCGWQRQVAEHESWLGMGLSGFFRVELDMRSGTVEVAHRKATDRPFRRMTADCLYGRAANDLRKHQQKIMQRITLTGR